VDVIRGASSRVYDAVLQLVRRMLANADADNGQYLARPFDVFVRHKYVSE
jgi:hypothetical protein